ncbi:unnamed protein product [Rangifer tarandus platyrhynchus]|uniref:Uncharacterized protein n=2 Tax=Rangifer tarandus platyrhynchus TaxID=3082113 RepID=A0ACB0FH77_RANTA|nr:unnamed protein product [Rangifer tarandus platyrhynchus]CAI9712256.1 unnamed protein product [Rangifer tarandus platyrhynchus]
MDSLDAEGLTPLVPFGKQRADCGELAERCQTALCCSPFGQSPAGTLLRAETVPLPAGEGLEGMAAAVLYVYTYTDIYIER